MTVYAIGDVQGCFAALEKLLHKINFNPQNDSLWFTGDLVNRGPQSLETLRFVKQLGKSHVTVLGNHDLHLIALAHGVQHHTNSDDTLRPILTAPDRDELIDWLAHQPLLHHDEKLNFVMTHAGIAPSWDLATAKKLALEVESVLQSEQRREFLQHLYGNEPHHWSPNLTGWDRLRCIVNHFTRMRFCHADGSLELKTKESVQVADTTLIPWFKVTPRALAQTNIIFGHWAALGGVTNTPHVYGIDTGCVWGFCLTALRLDNLERVSADCPK